MYTSELGRLFLPVPLRKMSPNFFGWWTSPLSASQFLRGAGPVTISLVTLPIVTDDGSWKSLLIINWIQKNRVAPSLRLKLDHCWVVNFKKEGAPWLSLPWLAPAPLRLLIQASSAHHQEKRLEDSLKWLTYFWALCCCKLQEYTVCIFR